MSTIHLHQRTILTPEQYIAGLTDFGPGRSKLFGNSADEYGWALSLVLVTIGRGVLQKAFRNSVTAIEAPNGKAQETIE